MIPFKVINQLDFQRKYQHGRDNNKEKRAASFFILVSAIIAVVVKAQRVPATHEWQQILNTAAMTDDNPLAKRRRREIEDQQPNIMRNLFSFSQSQSIGYYYYHSYRYAIY